MDTMKGGGVGIGALAILLIAAAYLAFAGGNGEEASTEIAGDTLTGPVTEVVDGDTAHVSIDGHDETVRFIGIDTPEVDPSIGVECFGKQASERNHELIDGERVRLEVGTEERDKYGRLLAYVYVGDEFINAELVRGGYAQTLEIPPNTDKAELLGELERQAADAGRGLWGAC